MTTNKSHLQRVCVSPGGGEDMSECRSGGGAVIDVKGIGPAEMRPVQSPLRVTHAIVPEVHCK